MNLILISFVVGATLFHQLQTLPSSWWFAALAPLALSWRYPLGRSLLALFAGAGWSLLCATDRLQDRLPAELEGEDLVLEAVVATLPSVRGRLVRFQADVDQLHDSGGNAVALSRLQLSWYRPGETIRVGDRWRLKVRLKRPRGAQNPAGGDFERWLYSQGIAAKGYVRKWHGNRILEQQPGTAWFDRLRQRIALLIAREADQPGAASLLSALAIGDKRGFGSTEWRVFSLTGTNHLVAISGLHIGIVAGWMLFLGQWLWRRSERLTLSVPALKAGSVAALAGAFAYAALAGFSLPTQRALLMLVAALGSVLLGRRIAPGRSLVLALFLVVLLDPMATLSAGFWLSFGAVAVIVWSVGGRLAPWTGWRQMLRVQWFVTLGLLPLLFLFFGQGSLIALVVNLIMVPWFTLVLVPLVLIGLPLLPITLLAGWWFGLLGWMASQTYQLLVWFSTLPYAVITLPDVAAWVWLAALLGTLLWMLPGGIPGRGLALCLVAPLFLAQPPRPSHGELWFTLLDVGQGLACVIETEHHLMVYDTGPAFTSGFNSAESVLIPYLRARGHKGIDRLLLSNGDMDHAGGYSALKQAFPIADILAGEAEPIAQARDCVAGESWHWDGVGFTLLHPNRGERLVRPNDRSCVMQISIGERRVLLPGDIEAQGERSLLAHHAEELASEIVVAPHHGSASSSSASFVTAVDPDWVLISSGYRNSYGFPKDEVVRRWRKQGAVILNTAETGAIEFRIGMRQTGLTPRLYRQHNRRYWSD
ncbi:MAG: DNA internalization-related competence protein ComEC/Rec2 [Candidatus Thiodiazotropha sp.]|nr:DNA internalization-related competence protein ComEC/Rec2 [Candidatus Thiodiazotropha sp. (ex Lucina pensylvanica)]PUB74839.1 MAG: DNA internalization-related competence protein ComEC/Rec2 [gamma proteobacterium symbiont of Ctena orbiculata]PUB76874.1 MAG: DNA internalization-related competence protein ComEC/Rec2 [gamma proteobacterium symbiont of Ctena orbiculata]